MTEEMQIGGGNRRCVQRKKPRKHGWTKARRTTFLAVLAETCNVTLATARAGMGCCSAYALRNRDPSFALLWEEALGIGYARLETLLLQRALEGANDIVVPVPDDSDGAMPAEPPRSVPRPGSGMSPGLARTDVQLALALLNRRGVSATGRAGRKAMSAEAVDALLAKKLDLLARQRGGAA